MKGLDWPGPWKIQRDERYSGTCCGFLLAFKKCLFLIEYHLLSIIEYHLKIGIIVDPHPLKYFNTEHQSPLIGCLLDRPGPFPLADPEVHLHYKYYIGLCPWVARWQLSGEFGQNTIGQRH